MRLLWLGVAINAAVVLAAKHFPYQDGANHLARYVLLDQAWLRGAAPAGVHARLLPTPYVAVDLLGAALVHVLGPDLALRVVTLAAAVLPAIGMERLLRRTAPDRRGWALVGVLLGLSWFVLGGMLNFSISVGLVFVWLAWWWPRRDATAARTRLAAAAGAVGLFFVHLSAPLSVLVILWIDVALAWLPPTRGGRDPRARAVTALVVTAAVGAVWASLQLAHGPVPGSEGAPVFRGAVAKAAALGAPFYSFDLRQALVLAAGWGACLVAFVYVNRANVRLDAVVLSAFAFLGLFAVSPNRVGLTGGVDVRWLVLAYLLPFCATERGRAPSQRPGLTVALLAVVFHAGVVWREVHRRDRLLAAYDDVLSALPPGSRLLPVVADGGASPRVGVYDEYAFWHVIRRAGRVPGLYNLHSTRPDDPPLIAHFAHFEVLGRPYVPPMRWGVSTFGPLDWGQIARDYDYIVQAGTDPQVTRYLGDHAQVRRREGAVTLYAVGSRP